MGGRPQFAIAGIPVRVEVMFPIILVLLGYTAYFNRPDPGSLILSFVAVAALSVLVHELGHALAYRHYGMQPRIVLHGWGGLTFGTGELSPGRSILVSLAGPVPPLLLFGVPALLFRSSAHLTGNADELLWQIVWINVGWSLLNLVPVLPLDGGNVCASAFELAFRGRGRMIANVVSLVVAALIAVFALLALQPFFLLIAVFFGFTNVMELMRREPAASAATSLVEAHRALLAGHPADAEALAQAGVAHSRTPDEQRWGQELVAWSRLLAGDVYGAHQVAASMTTTQPASQSFYGSLALVMGRRDEGVTVLTWAFVREPAGPAKSLAAIVAARTGAVDALSRELAAMGPEGQRAVDLLAQLVAYAGQMAGSSAPSARPSPPAGPVPMVASSTDRRLTPSSAPWPTPPVAPPSADGAASLPAAPPPVAPPAAPSAPVPPPSAPPPPPSAPAPPPPPPQAWPSEPPAAPPSVWRRPDE